LEVKAVAANQADGQHPLIVLLEQCGYKNVMLTHGGNGVTQAGSWRSAYQDQRSLDADPYDVFVSDEAGFVLPREDDNVLKDQTNVNTIMDFREKSKAMSSFLKMKSIAWEKRSWKVVNRQPRDGDKGGMIACSTVKTVEPVKAGYFLLQDENGADYWQLYQDGVAVENQYTYTPRDCYDVVAGEKYVVTINQSELDDVATKSGTPYDANTWPELSRDCLGWEVTVVRIIEDSDWPGYNVEVNVQHTEGGEVKTHTLPIRALRKRDPEATTLMMGEIGMWVLTAELQLFPADGYNCRGKSIQPLVSEFKGILETLCQFDDAGYMEVLDAEDDEDVANLNPAIRTWCAEVGADWSYDNW